MTKVNKQKMWKAPLTTVMRSGFEITGYAMNRGLATWAAPAAQRQTRSGFEVTGYFAVRE